MDQALEFIRPELSILILFIYCVGLFLKLNKEFDREWMIPYLLLGLSFFMTLAYVAIVLGEGISAAVVVAVTIQSVLIAAVAVFGNELIKQVLYKRGNDDRPAGPDPEEQELKEKKPKEKKPKEKKLAQEDQVPEEKEDGL